MSEREHAGWPEELPVAKLMANRVKEAEEKVVDYERKTGSGGGHACSKISEIRGPSEDDVRSVIAELSDIVLN